MQPKLYDLSVGKYDVDVKVGPSYATQREETREMLIEIMSRVDGAAPLIGDIVMEHMDFQGADKVAKRLKSLLPPQIQQAEAEENSMEGVPPEVQAALTQAQATIQQLQQQMQQMQAAMEAQASEAAGKTQLEDRKLSLEERRIAIEEENAKHQRGLADRKANDERAAQLGLPANGEPPENIVATLTNGIGQMLMALANQNAQTQALLAEVAKVLSAPKMIVRDKQGRPVGVAPQVGTMH